MLFSCRNEKSAYIMTSKVFNDFKGTQELEKKFQQLQQKQKFILDSLALEIQMIEKAPVQKETMEILTKKKSIYNQLQGQFEESNEEQYKQYSEGIWKQINQYVTEYGKENGLSFIHGANGSGALMYADSTLNITDKIITYINHKYVGN
jgi:outer membrane protein